MRRAINHVCHEPRLACAMDVPYGHRRYMAMLDKPVAIGSGD
jgi:hypothetical protein